MKGVYKITNQVTGNFYIGSALKIHKRWHTHLALLMNNQHHCKKLQDDFNAHSYADFSFTILELCNQESLKEVEQKYLDRYSNDNKLNTLPNSKDRRGTTQSYETKLKIKQTRGNENIYAVDIDNNILGEFEFIQEASEKLNISKASIWISLTKKQLRRNGVGFVKKSQYGKYSLKQFVVHNKGKKTEIDQEGKKVFVFTLYGDFVKECISVKVCGKFLESENISRQINKFPKIVMNRCKASCYIIRDYNDGSDIKTRWKKYFDFFKISTGNIKVYDIFNNHIGDCTVKDFAKLSGRQVKYINAQIRKSQLIESFRLIRDDIV